MRYVTRVILANSALHFNFVCAEAHCRAFAAFLYMLKAVDCHSEKLELMNGLPAIQQNVLRQLLRGTDANLLQVD